MAATTSQYAGLNKLPAATLRTLSPTATLASKRGVGMETVLVPAAPPAALAVPPPIPIPVATVAVKGEAVVTSSSKVPMAVATPPDVTPMAAKNEAAAPKGPAEALEAAPPASAMYPAAAPVGVEVEGLAALLP